MKRHFILLVALAVAVAVGGVSPIGAEAPAAASAETTLQAPEEPAVGVAGMFAAVDPETGELRQPTAEEIAQLTAHLESSFAESFEPREQRLESGGIAVELGDSLRKFAVVQVEADGTLSHHCVQGHHAAAEFVDTAAEEE